MNANDHFREAEQHLVYARESGDTPDIERIQIAYAQVHATLALAATNGADREHPGLMTVEQARAHASVLQGEEITDQMGDAPPDYANALGIPDCGNADPARYCVQPAGHDGDHMDRDGRYFE